MCNAFWPFRATRIAAPRLCCPFSNARCQRIVNNCDFHLLNRIDGPLQMRLSGGSCGSRHWVSANRLGLGATCARGFGLDDFFD